MKVLFYKSIDLDDIYYAYLNGIWQHGSNGKAGSPVGYGNPPGSAMLVKCTEKENGRWYILGITSSKPGPIGDKASEDWPSSKKMDIPKDYVAQVKFFPRVGELKSCTGEELSDLLKIDIKLKKYSRGGAVEVDEETFTALVT